MSDAELESKMLQGTVGYERKVNLEARGGNAYESATASIFIQFEIDPVADSDEVMIEKTRHAYLLARTHVFEQLGIPFQVSEGVAVELIGNAFPGAQVKSVPTSAPTPSAPTPTAPAATSPTPQAAGEAPAVCSKCGTSEGFWDNRPKKASGDFNPRSPDFKCKNKSCGNGVWLTPKGA